MEAATGEIFEQLKVLGTKSYDLGLIPRTHKAKEETDFPQVVLQKRKKYVPYDRKCLDIGKKITISFNLNSK